MNRFVMLLFAIVFSITFTVAQNSVCKILRFPTPIDWKPSKKTMCDFKDFFDRKKEPFEILITKTTLALELYKLKKNDILWTIFKYIPNQTFSYNLSLQESETFNNLLKPILDDRENCYIMLQNEHIISDYDIRITLIMNDTIIKQLNVTYPSAPSDLSDDDFSQIQEFINLYYFIHNNLINKF